MLPVQQSNKENKEIWQYARRQMKNFDDDYAGALPLKICVQTGYSMPIQ